MFKIRFWNNFLNLLQRVVATQELKKEIAAEAFATESRRNQLDPVKRLMVRMFCPTST